MLQDEYKFRFTDEKGIYIEDFIKEFRRRFEDEKLAEDIFCGGYCYHFACILEQLFIGSIAYNYLDNHFGFFDAKTMSLWDVTGKITDSTNWILWDYYQQLEPIESQRIIEQCMYKIYVG